MRPGDPHEEQVKGIITRLDQAATAADVASITKRSDATATAAEQAAIRNQQEITAKQVSELDDVLLRAKGAQWVMVGIMALLSGFLLELVGGLAWLSSKP